MITLNGIYPSHVLYRVRDLHKSVSKLRDAGFIVEYGTIQEKAYNALIWFNEGVFIEIYNNAGLPFYVKLLMSILGYKSVLKRMDKWRKIEEGWCEWSLESRSENLDFQKYFFRKRNIPFKFHKAKRRDINGEMLRWELLMPKDIDFPFLMSAYTPNPRPKEIIHPNGIIGVSKLLVGKKDLNLKLLNELFPNHKGLKFIEKASGLQTIEFCNSKLKIEDILK